MCGGGGGALDWDTQCPMYVFVFTRVAEISQRNQCQQINTLSCEFTQTNAVKNNLRQYTDVFQEVELNIDLKNPQLRKS